MQSQTVDDDQKFEDSFRYESFDLYHQSSSVALEGEFLKSVEPEIKTYHPSDDGLWYNRAGAENVLIKRPGKVFVHDDEGRLVTCFFKPSDADPIAAHEEIRLSVQVTLNMAPPPTGPRVSRLRGIVRDGTSVFGLLFDWIDVKGRLVPGKAPENSAELRERWATELQANVKTLHDKYLNWASPYPSSVLIDKYNNAWMVDFPGITLIGPGGAGPSGVIIQDLMYTGEMECSLRAGELYCSGETVGKLEDERPKRASRGKRAKKQEVAEDKWEEQVWCYTI
ncbi:Protein kinase-like domain protein [Apiospora saccharicola]